MFLKSKLSLVFLVFPFFSYTQDNRYLSFDLFFLKDHSNITFSQEYKFTQYINHVSKYSVTNIFIDTSMSISSSEANTQRIEELVAIIQSNNISDSLVKILNLPEYDSPTLQGFSDDLDAIKISIAYTSTQPINYFNYSLANLPVEKLIRLENEDVSHGLAYKNSCDYFSILELPYKTSLKINSCDKSVIDEDFTFNFFTLSELTKPQYFSKYASLGNIIGMYQFAFNEEKALNWPLQVNLPYESCLNKYEFSVVKVIDDMRYIVVPIENLYEPEDTYLRFNIKESGNYLLIHNHQKPYYQISMTLLPENLEVISAKIEERCNNIEYIASVNKNHLIFKIPGTYYEPVLTVLARDKKTNEELEIVKKPLSIIDGYEKIKEINVQDYAISYQNERFYSLYKRYELHMKDFSKTKKQRNL